MAGSCGRPLIMDEEPPFISPYRSRSRSHRPWLPETPLRFAYSLSLTRENMAPCKRLLENFEHETTAPITGILLASPFSWSPRPPHKHAKVTCRRRPSERVGSLGLPVGDLPRLTKPRKQSPSRKALCRPYVPFGEARLLVSYFHFPESHSGAVQMSTLLL